MFGMGWVVSAGGSSAVAGTQELKDLQTQLQKTRNIVAATQGVIGQIDTEIANVLREMDNENDKFAQDVQELQQNDTLSTLGAVQMYMIIVLVMLVVGVAVRL